MDTDEIERDGDVVASKVSKLFPSFIRCCLNGFGLLLLVALVATLIAVYSLSKRLKDSYQEEARLNQVCLGKALFMFENEYGSYPNESTIPEMLTIDPEMKDYLGTKSSNDFMRQLVVAGFLDQELVFGAEGVNPKAPDNRLNGSHLLEPGECVFSYVVWDDVSQLKNDAPILILPLIHGQKRFDRGTKLVRDYNKALILRHDTSVQLYPIDESGRVMVDGKDFFDPSQPYWSGQQPRIAWPE